MRRIILISAVVFLSAGLAAETAMSHPGGTNAAGCHTNRRTGEYHCHTPKAPDPSRTTYCHVINGEARCGYALSTCKDLAAQFGGHCQEE